MKSTKSARIRFTAEPELAEAATALAREKGMSTSAYLRSLIDDAVEVAVSSELDGGGPFPQGLARLAAGSWLIAAAAARRIARTALAIAERSVRGLRGTPKWIVAWGDALDDAHAVPTEVPKGMWIMIEKCLSDVYGEYCAGAHVGPDGITIWINR